MPRTCSYSFRGRTAPAEWRLQGTDLLITPRSGPTLPIRLKEVSGIAGDGYALRLAIGTETLCLERLGAEGPALLDGLRRAWLPLRAETLRLAGNGSGQPYAGSVVGAAASTPYHGLLFEEIFLFAPEGHDVQPLFLSLLSDVRLDDKTYVITCSPWEGASVVFGRMAGQTAAFVEKLAELRSRLADETSAVLARSLSTVDPVERSELSGLWLPGRVMSLVEMEGACGGFVQGLRSTWLPSLPRRAEAELLLTLADSKNVFLGIGPKAGDREPGDDGETGISPPSEPARPESEDASPAATSEGAVRAPAAQEPGDEILWLLVFRGDEWLLEALSETDHATYRFEGGHEIPSLVSMILCSPRLRWESIFLPLESFTGDRADLAIACGALPFLRELRSRFKGRIIHTSLESWSHAARERTP